MPPFAEFFRYQKLVLKAIWPYVELTWWFWLPPVLFYAAFLLWTLYLKQRYFANLKWLLLEVKIPKEIAKPPQAMEQVFAGIHLAYRRYDFDEKYREGLQVDHFSFEIVSVGGKIHFYIYAPNYYRNILESLIYAQYPDSEIREADNYLSGLPDEIPDDEWNLFGTEFALTKEDPYPIKTYKDFLIEDISLKEEARKVDPISALLEVFSKIKPHEIIGLQLLIRPTGNDWKEAAEEIVNKMVGKETPKQKGAFAQLLDEAMAVGTGLVSVGANVPEVEYGKKKDEEKPFSAGVMRLTPGEKDVVTAIQRNVTKLAFQTIPRFIYIGRKDEFDMMNFAAMVGVLRQFNSYDLNSFKVQRKSMTASPWYNPWRARSKFKKKRVFYRYYGSRAPFTTAWILKSKPFIFNTEELATIYHYPGETAGALTTQRIEAKKGEPPSDLPI